MKKPRHSTMQFCMKLKGENSMADTPKSKEKSWLPESVDQILANPGQALRRARRVWVENQSTCSAAVVGKKPRLSALYDAAGIPNVPARKEHTGCSLTEHGEILCNRIGQPAPKGDCRQAWCPHRRTMRMRLLARLQRKYAPGKNQYGGR